MKLDDINRIAAMVDAGDRIGAIKAFRTLANWGLYEAKMMVAPTVDSTGDEFRIKAMTEFISSPAELLAEFKVHVHKLEQIIAQFAELCDGFQAETPKLELKLGAKVQVVQCEDGSAIGRVGFIDKVDPEDAIDLCWHFREISDDEYPYTDWFTTEELEVIA